MGYFPIISKLKSKKNLVPDWFVDLSQRHQIPLVPYQLDESEILKVHKSIKIIKNSWFFIDSGFWGFFK